MFALVSLFALACTPADLDAARHEYQKALAAAPRDVSLHIALAAVLAARGDDGAAFVQLQAARALGVERERIENNAAFARMRIDPRFDEILARTSWPAPGDVIDAFHATLLDGSAWSSTSGGENVTVVVVDGRCARCFDELAVTLQPSTRTLIAVSLRPWPGFVARRTVDAARERAVKLAAALPFAAVAFDESGDLLRAFGVMAHGAVVVLAADGKTLLDRSDIALGRGR